MNKRSEDRISSPIILFAIYVFLMLYQPEGIGTGIAFISIALILLSCFFSGMISLKRVIVTRGNFCIFLFLIVVSIVTIVRQGMVSSYYKFAGQIIMYLVLAMVTINEREHSFLRWAFIISSVFYGLLAIQYCLSTGSARYFHSSILILGVKFDPNFIGIPFVAALTLLLNNIIYSRKRLLCMVLYFILAIAVVLTSSRGAMVAWILSSVLVLFSYVRKQGTSIRKWVLLIIIILLASVCINYVSNNYATQWTRMSALSTENDNGRFLLWGETIRQWSKAPLFGNGLRCMLYIFGRSSHNTYLQVLVDSGVVGAFLYVIFLIGLIKQAFRYDVNILIVLLGLMAQMLFLDALDHRVVWIVFCWIAMLPTERGDGEENENSLEKTITKNAT